jgi:PAS domain S-box-containing protein
MSDDACSVSSVLQSLVDIVGAPEKLDTLLNLVPDLICIADFQGCLHYLNRAGEVILGYPRETLIGTSLFHLVHNDDRTATGTAFHRQATEARDADFESRWRCGDGTYKILAWKFATVGHDHRIIGVAKDISARKSAEEILRANLNFRQTIIDTIPSPIFYKDRQGRYLGGNRAWSEKIFGLPIDRIVNRTVLDFSEKVSEKVALQLHQQDMTLMQDGGTLTYEASVDCADGELRRFIFKKAVYTDSQGVVAGMVGVMLDITEIKEMQHAILQSEAKYRSMMESMSDPVYICSSDFTVTYMNPAMIRRIGRDACGEPCHRALHDLEEKCPWCIFDKNTFSSSMETSVTSPKDHRTYRVTNMPIFHDDGTISKMTVFRDITEYLNAVKERENVLGQLRQAQKMQSIGTLAGGIAHDFNNILASVLGFTELALDDVEKGTLLDENLQEVYAAANRARELVKQILTFARQSDAEIEPVKIAMIAKEVLKFIRSSIPATIEIQQNVASDSLVMGNATQIHQIFMNICTNAAQAMEEEGGTLRIELGDVCIEENSVVANTLGLKPGNYVRAAVSDTGTGIPPDIIDVIFEPYFTTKEPGEGTGMGLAMVHGIIESYSGKITVESTPGKGSVFTVYFPVTRRSADQQPHVSEELPTGRERILYVDDESAIARMATMALEGLGYTVTARTSSVEALALFNFKPDDFDLVITDMTMPNITGDKLAVEVMRTRTAIPVILCTGYSKKISSDEAMALGIRALINKPIGRAELAKTVRKVLDEK